MMTTRFDCEPVPSWARAILFWRKVLTVERRGVPLTLGGSSPCPSR
jgi:hypothetical protein